MSTTQEVKRFIDYPFSDALQRDLAAAGYETPTPIQAQCIPPALEGKDLIGLAQTGTGKTAAFALPIIARLAHQAELGALVLAPTRELVHQIVGMMRALGKSSGLRVASIVGGVKMDLDHAALRSWPNVVVATPGRLIDHLEQKTVSLQEIKILIVDEADRMHDMGFIPQIRRILAHVPAERQTMMFTATMPADAEQIARRHMHSPLRILVGPASAPVERAEQRLFRVQETEKAPLLLDLLAKETGRVLVFLRTKRGVDRLTRRIVGRRHGVARLHGDREQAQRDEAMKGFREGRYRVLIATDIAARGLDIADIEHVINYDFPRAPEDYVHRIGRTARLEASGRATSFVTPADHKYVAALERLLKAKIRLDPAPPGSRASQAAAASAVKQAPGHGRHAAQTPRHGQAARHGSGHERGGPARPGAVHAHAPGAKQAGGHEHAPATREAHPPHAHGPAGTHAAGAPPAEGGRTSRRRRRRGRGRGGSQHVASAAAPAAHPSPPVAPAATRSAPPAPPAAPLRVEHARPEPAATKTGPTVVEWD